MKPLEHNTLLQNRYLVGTMIGRGGAGEVYLAIDQRVGGPVALKRTYFAGGDVLGGGFESEARALGRLRHPSLPKVTDHFVEGGDQFLVMEHVAGDDLATRLGASQRPFPLSWVMFWADQLLDAIVYLHSNEPPIVHRDIKPQNLKLTDNNNIVLLDFGLPRGAVATLENAAATVPGNAKPFAPLEQIRGNETTPRSDVYSLAATLYYLLTMVVPPDAAQRADAVLSGNADPLRPVSAINPEVPESIANVLRQGMAVSQDQRFADARSMQKALREAFARMHEAATEKTVVMESPLVPSATETAADAKTVAFPEPGPKTPATADMDSTIRYDGPIVDAPKADSAPRQADIKTELFFKPDLTAEETPVVATAPPAVAETKMPPTAPETVMPAAEPAREEPAPQPNATMPIVDLSGVSAGTPAAADTGKFEDFSATNDFSAPASPFADGGFTETVPPAEAGEPEPANEPAVAVPAAVAAPVAKKGTSKGLLIGILVAVFLLLVFGAGAAGLGWYFYFGPGSSSGTTTPTPTPSVSPTATPTATQTPDDSNTTNQNGTVTESPTPSGTPTPESTPSGDVTPDRPTTPVTRQTPVQPTPRQTIVTPQTPRPTVKPTVKPSAKPTLRGREIPQ